jgi:hypothetical protein
VGEQNSPVELLDLTAMATNGAVSPTLHLLDG